MGFVSTWRQMGWASALLLTGIAGAVLTMLGLAIANYFSTDKRQMRAMRRHRRVRRRAWETLRSTAPREIFREFHGK